MSKVIFTKPAKVVSNTPHTTYTPQQNIYHVYQLYEDIFNLKQDDQLLHNYYTMLKGKSDELSRVSISY